MSDLTYKRMLFEDDTDIPQLIMVHQIPEIARYYSNSGKNRVGYNQQGQTPMTKNQPLGSVPTGLEVFF